MALDSPLLLYQVFRHGGLQSKSPLPQNASMFFLLCPVCKAWSVHLSLREGKLRGMGVLSWHCMMFSKELQGVGVEGLNPGECRYGD